MRIGYKLAASYMAIAVVIALLGLINHRTVRETELRLATVKHLAIVGIVDAGAMNDAIDRAHFAVYRHLVAQVAHPVTSDEVSQDATAALNRQLETFERSLERSRQANARFLASSSNRAASLGELQEKYAAHRAMLQKSIEESAVHPTEARRRFDEEIEPHFRQELLPQIEAYQHEAEREFTVSIQAIETQLGSQQFNSTLLSFGAIVVSIGLGFLVSKQIVGPLRVLHTASEQIGAGNFDVSVATGSKDELGTLGEAFNRMRGELQATMVSRQRLEAALTEKEVLLREVHHRVKNNLQIISSFLRLQAVGSHEPALEQTLNEIQGRVSAMARIHEQLHESDDLANVEIRRFVQDLCRDLARTHDQRDVAFDVDADTAYLPLDVAIPCGMILHELAANSLKHAIPESNRSLQITMIYRANPGRHTLGVTDNGHAFSLPSENAGGEVAISESVGLKVVRALARQLNGSVEFTADARTCIMLTYPGPDQEAPIA